MGKTKEGVISLLLNNDGLSNKILNGDKLTAIEKEEISSRDKQGKFNRLLEIC